MFTWIKKLFIPKGDYCYQFLKIIKTNDKFGIKIKTRECPFYRHIAGLEGFCALVNDTVDDECKICGIHNFTDEEWGKLRPF